MKNKILYIQIVDAANKPEELEQLPVITVIGNSQEKYILGSFELVAQEILALLVELEEYSEYIPFAIEELGTRASASTPPAKRIGGGSR